MMRKQSLEFNIGYAFSMIEKKYIQRIVSENLDVAEGNFWIPKCWFGLRPVKDPIVDLSIEEIDQIRDTLKTVFSELAPKCSLYLSINPDNQYIKFDYTIKKIPKIKKMTVSQIEESLGYKVEIVSGE